MKAQIRTVKITDESIKKRIKKHNLVFKSGPNLLIGPNGSGKSTLFELLTVNPKCTHKSADVVISGGNFFAFDFEKHNPRKKSYFDNPSDIVMRFKSHGESNKAILDMLKTDSCKDYIVLLDEPEQALDVKGIANFRKIVQKTKASQMIIITHHPFLIMDPIFNIVELVDGYYDDVVNYAAKFYKGETNVQK